MLSDKEAKKILKKKAEKEPEKYYPVRVLQEEGYERRKCSKCGQYFWTTTGDDYCGEPECQGGYTFIKNPPTRKKLGFVDTWEEFKRVMQPLGYTPIKRYPVIARWNPTIDYTNASIAGFQPYVVSGEVEPPANPLIIPQTCVRWNDIENVGVTGRHYTGFVMVGQHAFVKPEEWNQEKYFRDIFTWLTKGLGLKKDDIKFHEDAWSGGGNSGLSMEYFCRGLELGNQVYMSYQNMPDGTFRELSIKVLDMGMGLERYPWLTHGTLTSYEANMPLVVKKLYEATGIKPDHDVLERFLPYSGLLNIDETEDIDGAWRSIAQKCGLDVRELKQAILPLAAIYSIADHSRSALWCIADGGLPSNTGGGYNIRIVVRRALGFINRYGWNIDLGEVAEWHAREERNIYPELLEEIENVKRILGVEKKKYEKTMREARSMIKRLEGKNLGLEELVELYDSHGISPDMLREAGLEVEAPPDFFSRVAERHETARKRELVEKTVTEEDSSWIEGVPETRILYYDDYLLTRFRARVVRAKENLVVLDQTAFYPESGGQDHDTGRIGSARVERVYKTGPWIVHVVEGKLPRDGEVVECEIDRERRIILTRHHTAAHVVNGAARRVLGNHVWQAGAEKRVDGARLDITHYESISLEEEQEIEGLANNIVEQGIPVESMLLERNRAEREYGFRIYQGGAVPGRILRIVKIGGHDVEACGGTHVKNTREIGPIRIRGTSKIQDGVVRIEFVAGDLAREMDEKNLELAREIASLVERIGLRVDVLKDPIQTKRDLAVIARDLATPREHTRKTLERMVRDIERAGTRKEASMSLGEVGREVFSLWKAATKKIEKQVGEMLENEIEEAVRESESLDGVRIAARILEGVDQKSASKIAASRVRDDTVLVLVLRNKRNGLVVAAGERAIEKGVDARTITRELARECNGKGGGSERIAQGVVERVPTEQEIREIVKKILEGSR